MKNIILEANQVDGIDVNIVELRARLSQLTDSRNRRGRIYELGMVLVLVLLAKLSGEDKPAGIAGWIRHRKKAIVEMFDCKHNRVPCLNTIRAILQDVVILAELEKLFSHYLHETFGGQQSELVAIDGKTMRGTIPKGSTRGVHLLSAYLPEEGITLKQVIVDNKENEIVAAPQLLSDLDIAGRVVCADAMQTQRNFSVEVLRGGGDYLLCIKDNQPTLHADVARFFDPPRISPGWLIPELPSTTAQTCNGGHGRIEKRTLTLIVDNDNFLNWPGVRQVFKLERYRRIVSTGKESTETVFGITSCAPDRATAKQILHWCRDYWGVENGLHYRRDVTLREDATRLTNQTFAQVLAAINNFIVGLSAKMGYASLPDARRAFDAQIASQLR
ncbi:MAG: ISAs1 family transposase [Gammaproteobacteria bacterium]|nr:ISAs1 family transposase [Gammaproteobacteria bacterium]